MEEALKSRQLASASVRKQRIAERQRQKELLYQQREERRRRLARYSEAYSTGSEHSRANSPELDSSAETPSECSAQTPDNMSTPDIELKVHMLENTEDQMPATSNFATDPESLKLAVQQPPSKPLLLGASLNRPCDFRYDRFSTFMGHADTSEQEKVAEEDSEDEEDYSPIEIATPISFSMPTSRPAVIKVVHSAAQKKHKRDSQRTININTNVANPVALLTQQDTSGKDSDVAILAREARPSPFRNMSSSSVVSAECAYPDTMTPLDHAVADQYLLKKKSSMPMLSKLTHSRMSSIKQFIKPPAVSPSQAPAIPQIPLHHSRPSTGISNLFRDNSSSHKNLGSGSESEISTPAGPRRSLTEPNLLVIPTTERSRPQTARHVSQSSVINSSAASIASTTPSISIENAEDPNMNRKKSFQNLRRRSGSLGQALKFSSSRSKNSSTEGPLPPMPLMISVLPQEPPPQTLYTPPPPPKTPRSLSARKSGMMLYSPFPPSQKGEPVGLGLRM